MVLKKRDLNRKLVFNQQKNKLEVTIKKQAFFELSKKELEDAIKATQIAIGNLRGQRANALKEIKEHEEILKGYKKHVNKFITEKKETVVRGESDAN